MSRDHHRDWVLIGAMAAAVPVAVLLLVALLSVLTGLREVLP
jgi:hypothetical protein